jgi:hypothetical protein
VISDATYNTLNGTGTLHLPNHGGDNTASGYEALYSNTGSLNTANGVSALYANTTGEFNTAVGSDALNANTTGNYNIALGEAAGSNLTVGSNNIDIANAGVAGESNTIRIGTVNNQTATYVAGIVNTPVLGVPVFITANGKLGVLSSSERYKTDIRSMELDTTKLDQLRPVTFHLKSDPNAALQYGLIAEEVDKVYPDLVVRNTDGRIEGVRYDELAPILLKEVQTQRQALAADDAKFAAQQQQLNDLKQQFAQLAEANKAMQAALVALTAKGSQVAMR